MEFLGISKIVFQSCLGFFIIKMWCPQTNIFLLLSNMKRIIGIIVGLLKDKVSVGSFPTSKRVRIEKIIKK